VSFPELIAALTDTVALGSICRYSTFKLSVYERISHTSGYFNSTITQFVTIMANNSTNIEVNIELKIEFITRFGRVARKTVRVIKNDGCSLFATLIYEAIGSGALT